MPGSCSTELPFLHVSKKTSLKAALEKGGGSCHFSVAKFPVLRRKLVTKLVELCLKTEGTALIKACLFVALPKDDDDYY